MIECEPSSEFVAICMKNRTGEDWCRYSPSCKGWGCRLLMEVPESVPRTKLQRANLFTRIYRAADYSGVLECPFFNEANIDAVIDDKKALSDLIKAVDEIEENSKNLQNMCKR